MGNPRVALLDRLEPLRADFARAAQFIHDRWDQVDEDDRGGICDTIAEAMGVVASRMKGTSVTDGGQDGDDHAFIVVLTRTEAVAVDIPPGVYEIGGGYNWRKRKGVTIQPDDVVFNVLRRSDFDDEDS